jgi:hypothetical protein
VIGGVYISSRMFGVGLKWLTEIEEKTKKYNLDNISRTVSYADFYERNPEVTWSFLASMVSRNAGWSMTDLVTKPYKTLLSQQLRNILFLTYERANWLIFSDAFPQLLLYEKSKEQNTPLFHHLKSFGVSSFMELEWQYFWHNKDIHRLATALIINEQHVIQRPVIEHPFYHSHVFKSVPFKMQEWLHFSTVLFPSLTGKLFGFSVDHFTNCSKRIYLGKRLYWLLIQSQLKELFVAFSKQTPPTGSRGDYEQYQTQFNSYSPKLRDVFPVVNHHRKSLPDWYKQVKETKITSFFDEIEAPVKYELTKWFQKKRFELALLAAIERKIKK